MTPREPDIPRRFVLELARDAGRIAQQHFRRVEPEIKEDRTVVTRADREVEQFLTDAIRRRYPHHGILGEEGARANPRDDVLWALDPIDGTSAYIRGIPFYTVSIGILVAGRPRMGVVRFPSLRDAYSAVAGRGAWEGRKRLKPITDPRPFHRESLLLLPSNTHRRYCIDFRGKGRSLGSAAGQICHVARGTAQAALVIGSLWDIAAAAVILGEAGGELRYLSGRPVEWTELLRGGRAPEPLLAAHPAAMEELGRRIVRRP